MPNRLRSSLAAVSLLAGCCLPVLAQDAPPSASNTAAVNAAASVPAGAPLTLDECVRRALENGFAIEIQRFNPGIAKDAVDIARGSFIPTLSLTGSDIHSNAGPIGGNPGTKSDASDTRLGITELFQTGTAINVSTSLDRSYSNPASFTAFYNPAYTSDVTI